MTHFLQHTNEWTPFQRDMGGYADTCIPAAFLQYRQNPKNALTTNNKGGFSLSNVSKQRKTGVNLSHIA